MAFNLNFLCRMFGVPLFVFVFAHASKAISGPETVKESFSTHIKGDAHNCNANKRFLCANNAHRRIYSPLGSDHMLSVNNKSKGILCSGIHYATGNWIGCVCMLAQPEREASIFNSSDITAGITVSESVRVLLTDCGSGGIVWMEDFNDLADGTKSDNGSTAWSIDDSGINTGYMQVSNKRFVAHGSGTDSEMGLGIWISEEIDISAYSDIILSVYIEGEGSLDSGQDYIRVFYRLDDGAETLFIDGDKDGGFNSGTVSSPMLNGNSVQIVIRTKSTGDSEYYYYDNIKVAATSQSSFIATATTEGNLSCNSNVKIIAEPSGAGYTYNWTGPNGYSADTRSITVEVAGDYTVAVTSIDGCTGTATATVSSASGSSATIWLEDFEDNSDGAIVDNGATGWSQDYPGSGISEVQSGRFKGNNLDNESVWISETIDISPYSEVHVSFDLEGAGSLDRQDYFRAYYAIDGGGEVMFFNDGFNGSYDLNNIKSATFSGNSLQLFIRQYNTGSDEVFYFDNVKIYGTGSGGSINAYADVGGALSCVNSSVEVNGGPSGEGYTYSWSGPNGFSANTPAITVGEAGDYVLTVTGGEGCTGTVTATVLSAGGSTGTLWLEDFSDLSDGAAVDNGITAWSLDYSGSGDFHVLNNAFYNNYTGSNNEAVWISEAINISGLSGVVLSVDIRSEGGLNNGGSSLDYLRVYYKLDGNQEVLVSESLGMINNNNASFTNVSAASLVGSSLQVVIRSLTTGGDEYYYFDNIKIIGDGPEEIDVSATVDGILSCSNNKVTITGGPDGEGYSYNWTGPNGFSANSKDVTVSASGDYVLTVIAPEGCSGRATETVSSANGTSGILWLEDFDDLSDGTKADAGTTAWTIDDSGLNTGWMEVRGQRFVSHGSDVDSEIGTGIWMSEVIDISSSTDVVISVEIEGEGSLDSQSNKDYLKIYYKLDGGDEMQFINGIIVGGFEPATIFSPTLNGNNVQIIIRSESTGDSEYYYYDNITVTGSGGQTNIIATASVDGILSCNNPVTVLRGSSNTEGVTYQWTGPNGFSSSFQNPEVSDSGTYILIVEGDADCATSDTVSVKVLADNEVPDVSINKDGDITCQNKLISIQASSSHADALYSWSGPDSYSSEEQNIEVAVAGYYYLTIRNLASGCASIDSISVGSDTDSPVITIRSKGKLNCANNQVLLKAISSTNRARFSWSGPNAFAGSGQEVYVESGGTYSLFAVDTINGCYSTANINVEPDTTSPGVNLMPHGKLDCGANFVQFGASSPTQGVAYLWTGPQSFVSTQSNPVTSIPGSYTVLVINPVNGCTSTGLDRVEEDYAFPQGVSAEASGVLSCLSEVVNLIGASSNLDVYYSWIGPNGFYSSEQNPTANEPGTYKFTVTNNTNQCEVSVLVKVLQELDSPDVAATVSGVLTCTDTVVVISGSSSISGANYSWSGPGISNGGQHLEVSKPGTYILQVTDPTNGCSYNEEAIVQKDTKIPEIMSIVVSGAIDCAYNPVTLTATSLSTRVNYLWEGPGGFSSDLQETLTIIPGNYMLRITDPINGCYSESDIQVLKEVCFE